MARKYLLIIKYTAVYLFFEIRTTFHKTGAFLLRQVKSKDPFYPFLKKKPPGNYKTHSSENSPDSNFVDTVQGLVEKNISKPDYSVQQLSSDLCMDRTNLYRKLTDSIEQPPSRYIRCVRTRQASKLIINTDLSLKEISLRVGFRSYSHFIKCFTKDTGLTPQEFRLAYRYKNPKKIRRPLSNERKK